MSAGILQAVQQGMYSKLSGDGVLMDMVTGVHDAVPQQAAVPYIVIGDGEAVELPQLSAVMAECRMVLHVWTAGSGRKAALAILNRLHGLLHHGALSLPGHTLLAMRAIRAETQVDAEHDRVYGVMELSLTVAAA